MANTELETPTGAGGLSRRTLVKGAAWSVPVIAFAGAAPAFAGASQTVCEDLYPSEYGGDTDEWDDLPALGAEDGNPATFFPGLLNGSSTLSATFNTAFLAGKTLVSWTLESRYRLASATSLNHNITLTANPALGSDADASEPVDWVLLSVSGTGLTYPTSATVVASRDLSFNTTLYRTFQVDFIRLQVCYF